MQETTQQQPKQSKEQISRGMNLGQADKEHEMSSSNTANELKSLSQTNQQRKVNDKQVDFLVKEMGMDKIKATNILRKLQLKQAVKYVLDN